MVPKGAEKVRTKKNTGDSRQKSEKEPDPRCWILDAERMGKEQETPVE